VRKQLISLALLALMPLAAQAQDEDDSGFNWNAAATSEYMFRGISQTDDKPAIQAGAGYSWSNGLYVGAWASNVDFGESTDAEVDTFIGWNGDLSDSVNLDVQLVRYNYVGEPDGVDYAYNELIGKLSFAENYSATLGYTNDYLNSSTDSIYAAVGGSWEVGDGYNITAGVGYTTVDDDLATEDGYIDYSVGVNRDFGPVNIGVSYIGTDNNGEDLFGEDNAEEKFVVTFSVGG
jgi:uncharacterized protein (TIGR02001 family)